jgi:hypothetical protein
MTTEGPAQPRLDAATQARLDALRERRAPSNKGSRPGHGKNRRRHHAVGARILAGSLSASTALALMALMSGADSGATAAESNLVSASPEPLVIFVRPDTDTAPSVRTAPRVAASNATPVTSSHAS